MVSEALQAADKLQGHGISAEVIDLRTISPMDNELIFDSVRRTHRLIVADTAWRSGGIGSEIIARVVENLFSHLKAPARCVASPDVPAPVSSTLERLFYPGANEIVSTVIEVVSGKPAPAPTNCPAKILDEDFHGPF